MTSAETQDTLQATELRPPRKPRHTSQEGYARAVRVSFALHGLFLALIIFKSLVFPSTPIPFAPTLRVDMVGLPDVLKKDLHNVPSESSKEIAEALKHAESEAKKIKPVKIPDLAKTPIEKADKDELVLKPKQAVEKHEKIRENRLKSALARIKALDKIEDSVEPPSPAKAAAVVKGNKVSKGSSLAGDAKEAAQASYYDALRGKLQENWALPVWIARQNYSAQVQIFIDAYGRLRSFRFTKPSGNAQFDSAIKKTLEESQPFAHPPDDLAASILTHGVLVGFPL